MITKSISTTSVPLRDRLSVKFTVLFAAAFLIIFLGGLIYDAFASKIDNQQNGDNSLSAPAAVPIEPKIESDLAKVLAFDPLPNLPEIKDPFADKGGISNNAQMPAGTVASVTNRPIGAVQQQSVIQSGSGGSGISGSKTIIPGKEVRITTPLRNGQVIGTGQEIPVNYIASAEATKERIRLRQEKMRAGQDAGPESTVLSVDDLLPVGVVSGGDDQLEIILYSQALGQTYSFPIGTRFYDGWLVDWKPEGVGFAHNKENGAVYLKTWARFLKQPNS